MSEPKYVKVYFADDESGWAEDLGDGTVKVANCPLTPKFSFGDICSIYYPKSLNMPMLHEVIKKAYKHTATVWYKDLNTFYLLRGAFHVLEWASEGGCGPKDDHEGFMTVNFNGEESGLQKLIDELIPDDGARVEVYEGE